MAGERPYLDRQIFAVIWITVRAVWLGSHEVARAARTRSNWLLEHSGCVLRSIVSGSAIGLNEVSGFRGRPQEAARPAVAPRLAAGHFSPLLPNSDVTADNLLRHTVYVGLREDKPTDQVRRER
jgi:hypothetical protein